MHPTRSDTEEARAAQQDARQAELRLLVEHHAGLVQELHGLHEQALSLLNQEQISPAQRREQLAAQVRAEAEVLEEARHVRLLFHDLLSALHRHTQEEEEPHERLPPAPTPGDE
jgi:NADPH-dependent ferric siderophore reductase